MRPSFHEESGSWSQLDLQSWHDQAAALGMTVADLAASNPTCPVGHDTDDTLLLLSLTEAIVVAGGKPPDTATCAARVVEAWKHNEDPSSALCGLRGFGSGTQQVIKALAAGMAPDETGTMVRAEGSNRNGGPMRIAPIGLLFADHGVRSLHDLV